MINETLNTTMTLANVTVGEYFWAVVIGALIALVPIMLIFGLPMIKRTISLIKIKIIIRNIMKKTDNHLMILAHMEAGLFGSMITTEDLIKIEKIIREFKGQDFDLLLHTPGGSLFASIKIANLLHNYPGKVRAFVPKYAMSGGTLLALACNEIHMADKACLGPVDPQLGNLLKIYSAKAWKEILKFKGKKVNDDTIAMNLIGKQATITIKNVIKKFVKTKKQVDVMTNGNVIHSQQFDKKYLKELGLDIKNINNEEYDKIIERFPKSETVVGKKHRGK